jgi:hypothetical protein
MKTTTILSAYLEAEDRRQGVFAKRRRQADKFGAALLARIEAGDRAREALKQVEWFDTTGPDYPGEYCPWCDNDYHDGHAPDCPRQAALGLQP